MQRTAIVVDGTFVPAAKPARYRSIDFNPGPSWQGIAADLHEHIDGPPPVCPRPL